MIAPPSSPYIELHCHSSGSLLDGASHPEELVARAAALDMPALAITDHDAVYAVPGFIRTARRQGIRPILGSELTLSDGHHLTLLVENEVGWHNLCYLISRARHTVPKKGEAALPPEELVGCTSGLIALSGCRQGKITMALRQGDRETALAAASRYRDLFGPDNFWIELQRHLLPGEKGLIPTLADLASHLQLECVVTNNVHYVTQDRHRLQNVLVCIRYQTTLDAATHLRRFNSEYYLKSGQEMAALFPDYPRALANTYRLAERCRFELSCGLQDLPQFPTPHGMSSTSYLRRLCQQALLERYPNPPTRAREQLAHELNIIERANLANYFLIVWDLIRYACSQSISCQGRGSAANSLVAYLLHISPIDPLVHDLVFERFLSDERQVVPDIDIDFDANRREEIIQYAYNRYGANHVAMVCTFVTFRARSALRDIAKVLGVSPELVSTAAQVLDIGREPVLVYEADTAPLNLLLDLCYQIEGFPRHLSIHPGGMVITGAPLVNQVPTEPATMPDRTVIQWDKDGLEDVGLIKFDMLSLRILSAITEAVALVKETIGEVIDLEQISFDDPSVYNLIAEADTIGVFQVESRAQTQMLPHLKPRCFEDLIIAISLIRPGPIQAEAVHPYLRRRMGLELVTYLHPLLKRALRETLGVVLFQEQVIKIARDFAGFTAGQGELLRRALGTKRSEAEIERFHDDFMAGAQAKGVPADIAEKVFDQLRAFGGFSFAKSHASSFAVLVYRSAWLKRYHFTEYFVALLNNQPMGFWQPAVLINEAKRRGVDILPVNLHQSLARCTVDDGGSSIRLGLNYVKGLREEHINKILENREKASFSNLLGFCQRTRISRQVVENLIWAGAMDDWGIPRRRLLWELGTLQYQEDKLDLVFSREDVPLPQFSPAEAILMEQSVLGLSPGDHVMSLYRELLVQQGILGSRQLATCNNGQHVRVAGLMVVHQAPPTAKQHHFVTLEDEDGMINVIIRPRIYARYRQVLGTARLLVIEGVVQQSGGVVDLLASRVAALP